MGQRSVADKALLGFALVFLVAVGAAAYFRQIPPWIGWVYGGASLVILCVYGWDKYRAQKEQWRVAEATLHFLELFGGWPGALIAQRMFLHKNRKVSFQVVFWLIAIAHLTLWGWVIFLRYRPAATDLISQQQLSKPQDRFWPKVGQINHEDMKAILFSRPAHIDFTLTSHCLVIHSSPQCLLLSPHCPPLFSTFGEGSPNSPLARRMPR